MSCWKKASKSFQRDHRERHQPQSRAHLGLLEKKKDYQRRAKHHHKEENLLKLLRRRALSKNPDEFYMHMVNSKLVNGVHHEKIKEDTHTPEQIKLLQSKDMRYVEFKRNIESKKIDRIQSELHMTEVANKVKNTHVFFVDSADEVKNFNLAERLDTHPILLDRKTNRIRKKDLKDVVLPDVEDVTTKITKKAYQQLGKRLHREKQLSIVQQKLQIKQDLKEKRMKKPKQIKPGTKEAPPVYKWEYERKK